MAAKSSISSGSYIALHEGVLKASCIGHLPEDCALFDFTNASSVAISPPLSPVVPNVVLLISDTSACDDVVLDATSSTGKSLALILIATKFAE